MISMSKTWLSVLLCFAVAPQVVTALRRFRSWFPIYEVELNNIVNHNCSSEFAEWNSPGSAGQLWRHSNRASLLINCILTATSEIMKADFNSAAVVLGLMPGLFALFGPGIQDTSILLAFGDHPLLTLIICCGSPMIGLDRELHIRGTFRSLGAKIPTNFGLCRGRWLTCFQYIIALAAITNTAEMASELSIRTTFSWFDGNGYVIGVWAFIGFVTHLMGSLALSCSTYIDDGSDLTGVSAASLTLRWLRWRCSFAKRERPIRVVVQPHSLAYFLYVAMITFFTLFQIFFGTLVFSSILFIGVHNAVQVWVRFMCSVMACRILVLMELGFMQEVVKTEDANSGDGTAT